MGPPVRTDSGRLPSVQLSAWLVLASVSQGGGALHLLLHGHQPRCRLLNMQICGLLEKIFLESSTVLITFSFFGENKTFSPNNFSVSAILFFIYLHIVPLSCSILVNLCERSCIYLSYL